MGVLLVYDVANPESLHSIVGWMEEVQKHAKPGVQAVLIGNKADDLGDGSDNTRRVSRQDGEELARQIGVPFFETRFFF